MRWILLALGCLTALVVVVAVVGSLLPKGHVASRRARFAKPPEVIFAILTNFKDGPSWRPALKSVEDLAERDGKHSFREVGPNGELTYIVDALRPPSLLVTRIVDNASFGGTWTYELQPDPAGSLLVITERGEVYNPIFRFMGHFFFSPTATMEAYLQALGKKLGETVSPE